MWHTPKEEINTGQETEGFTVAAADLDEEFSDNDKDGEVLGFAAQEPPVISTGG